MDPKRLTLTIIELHRLCEGKPGQWGPWGPCSKSCGTAANPGTMQRSRVCNGKFGSSQVPQLPWMSLPVASGLGNLTNFGHDMHTPSEKYYLDLNCVCDGHVLFGISAKSGSMSSLDHSQEIGVWFSSAPDSSISSSSIIPFSISSCSSITRVIPLLPGSYTETHTIH